MLQTLPQNPFVTRHTRPGVLPPLDAEGRPVDVANIVEGMYQHGEASIEGPHGTGKTTLLTGIARALKEDRRLGGAVRICTGRERVAALQAIHRAAAGTFVCIDGWDALGPLSLVARFWAWARQVGLVVTSHRATGFSYGVRTQATLPLLAAIVKRLPDHGGLIEETDLSDALKRHPGNIREALLDLYDRFEHRARTVGW